MDLTGIEAQGVEFGGFSIRDVRGLKFWSSPDDKVSLGAARVNSIEELTQGFLFTNTGIINGKLYLRYVRSNAMLYGVSTQFVRSTFAPKTELSFMYSGKPWTGWWVFGKTDVSTRFMGVMGSKGTSSGFQAGTAGFNIGSDDRSSIYNRFYFSLGNIMHVTLPAGSIPVSTVGAWKVKYWRAGTTSYMDIYRNVVKQNETPFTSTAAVQADNTPSDIPLEISREWRGHIGDIIIREDTGIAQADLDKDEAMVDAILAAKYL